MVWNFRGETNISNPYSDSQGYQTAYQQLFDQLVNLHSDSEGARQGVAGRLVNVTDQFKTLWTNMVGRAPTSSEVDSFLGSQAGSIIANSAGGLGRSEQDPTNVRNQVTQYIGDNGQKASQDYATQQLQAQQGQATDLANLFRTQGKQAISNTESGLLDYQQRLFERLRPNLITSLQSQGLLNTGGLNEAMAGAQKDLGDQSQQFLLQANLDNENKANAIEYGGASAPYAFAQNNIMNQPNALLQQGQNALTANTNTFMSNLDYQHQLGLLSQQNKYMQENKPSFLQNLGTSFANSAGGSLGQWFSPNPSGQSGGSSGPAAAKALFA